MDIAKEKDYPTCTAAFIEGEVQGSCHDGCCICLEDFSQSDPSTVTDCKHEFHLHCILEWCYRSSNCPMCWQPISLKDGASQQLLEVVEHERSLRANKSRNRTAFYHPTFENPQSHLPTDISELYLEEHIFQHLAAAASMRSGHLIFRREGQSSRSPSQGLHPFFVYSAPNAPHEASVLTSLNPVGSGSHSTAVSLGPPQTDVFAHRVGSDVASANRQRVLSETRSFAGQSSLGSWYMEEPSDLQSLSESLRSRFNSWSMRYKESISRNTRGLKERLFAGSTSMADLGSEVRREVNSGIAGLSRMMERLDSRVNNGSGHASQSSHAGRSTINDNS